MKLLIDIPLHVYEHAKEGTEDGNDEFTAIRAIENGTPLMDDIETFEILKEIKNDCKNRRGCKGCKFFPCKICDLPAYWDV
ncbi:MAG: hypothetical protein IIW86_04695 [Clostridia bacterium]|nr:hypothetical protein [Clostridia bacterium]